MGLPLTDPNLAFLLLVSGMLGLYWELHTPGGFVPGLIGLLLVAAGLFGLAQDAPTWYGMSAIALAALLLGAEMKIYSHGISGLAGALLLSIGAVALVRGPHGISPVLAGSLSVALAAIALFLGYLGMKTRHLKPRTGSDELVGEVGRTRTNLEPEGTVFVRGEYWRARSSVTIPAGSRVLIERVEGLLLYVKGA
jgi:membrane-bound serine protease (ClpP class)